MMHSNNYLDEENKDTKPFLEEITNDVNEHENIENNCVLTKINNSNIKNKKTTRKLKFSREEKSNILNNKMLSDESIDLAQQLLKKQFPMFGGLQDIALSEHYGLDVVKKDKPFIQVLYNGSVHWIGYVYLILIETGLKTILAILRIVYLEEKLQNMLRRNRCFITLQGTCHKSCHKSGTAIRKWSKLWSFCNSICTSLAFGGNTSLCSYNVPILR